MGPNSINNFSSLPALGTAAAPAEAATATTANTGRAATAGNGIKINYGDSIKAERLQAGLRGLQSAQAKTELFIRSINPELGKL